RAIGEFQNEACANAVGIALMDHVFKSCRHQQVAIDANHGFGLQEFVVSLARRRGDRKALGLGSEQKVQIKAVGCNHGTAGVRNSHDLVAISSKQGCDMLAGIAEALDYNTHGPVEAEFGGEVAHEVIAAAGGSV